MTINTVPEAETVEEATWKKVLRVAALMLIGTAATAVVLFGVIWAYGTARAELHGGTAMPGSDGDQHWLVWFVLGISPLMPGVVLLERWVTRHDTDDIEPDQGEHS